MPIAKIAGLKSNLPCYSLGSSSGLLTKLLQRCSFRIVRGGILCSLPVNFQCWGAAEHHKHIWPFPDSTTSTCLAIRSDVTVSLCWYTGYMYFGRKGRKPGTCGTCSHSRRWPSRSRRPHAHGREATHRQISLYFWIFLAYV
jgi:hypothetical protein